MPRALARFIPAGRAPRRESMPPATRVQKGAAVGLVATKPRAGHPDGLALSVEGMAPGKLGILSLRLDPKQAVPFYFRT